MHVPCGTRHAIQPSTRWSLDCRRRCPCRARIYIGLITLLGRHRRWRWRSAIGNRPTCSSSAASWWSPSASPRNAHQRPRDHRTLSLTFLFVLFGIVELTALRNRGARSAGHAGAVLLEPAEAAHVSSRCVQRDLHGPGDRRDRSTSTRAGFTAGPSRRSGAPPGRSRPARCF